MANQTTMKNIVSYETVVGASRCRKKIMCRSVGTDSPCPHGDKCKFAHDESELKSNHLQIIDYGNMYKTQMCKNAGNCSYGSKCKYAHTSNEIRKRLCNFGDKCSRPECQFQHPTGDTDPKVVPHQQKWLDMAKSPQVVKSETPVTDPKCIRVPKSLAIDMFKLMLERGEKSISFELV